MLCNNKNFTIADVSTRVTLTKRIKDYDTWTPSVQCAAQLINAGVKKPNEFSIGDRIDYVKVNDDVSVTIPKGLAFPVNEKKKASVIPAELIKDVAVS